MGVEQQLIAEDPICENRTKGTRLRRPEMVGPWQKEEHEHEHAMTALVALHQF